MVPVITDAGDLNMAGLAKKIADLAERTRTNKIPRTSCPVGPSPSPTPAAAARCSTPRSSNQPQVGILGTGAVVKRPVVISHPELGEIIGIRAHDLPGALLRPPPGRRRRRGPLPDGRQERLEEAEFDVSPDPEAGAV